MYIQRVNDLMLDVKLKVVQVKKSCRNKNLTFLRHNRVTQLLHHTDYFRLKISPIYNCISGKYTEILTTLAVSGISL